MLNLSFVKTISRSYLEWFFVRGYSFKQVAQISDTSVSTVYNAVRAFYGADWKKVLNRKRKEFENEQSSISQFVYC